MRFTDDLELVESKWPVLLGGDNRFKTIKHLHSGNKPPMTKDEFTRFMSRAKKVDMLDRELNAFSKSRKMDFRISIPNSSGDVLILLEKLFHDDNGLCWYFARTLNWGKGYRPGYLSSDTEENVKLSTIGKLYDALVEYM